MSRTEDVTTQREMTLNDSVDRLEDLAMIFLKDVQSLRETHLRDVTPGLDFYDEARAFETDIIQRALEQTGGNQTQAARLLGLRLSALRTRINRYRISMEARSPLG